MKDELQIDPIEIKALLYANAENGYIHPTHHEDMLRYYYLQQGDMRAVDEAKRTLNPSMQGKLSNDPIRNMKYLFVVTTSLAARIAVEAGIPLETAYAISDLYIQKMDILDDEEEIIELCGELYATYIKHIRKIKQKNNFSKPIMQCLNYINSHFNENITLEKLSAVVDLHPNYLAALFKKETGETLKKYLIRTRVEVAESLLTRTEYTYTQISNSLAFCSQSHFTKVFRNYTGLTPKQYRMTFFDTNMSKLI